MSVLPDFETIVLTSAYVCSTSDDVTTIYSPSSQSIVSSTVNVDDPTAIVLDNKVHVGVLTLPCKSNVHIWHPKTLLPNAGI